MKLANRRAVITGGASGIGKAIALAYASEGADVAILDIADDRASSVAEEITRKHNTRAYTIHCDVGCGDAVEQAFVEVDRLLGGVDILVNNTGVIRFSPIVEMCEDEWDLILRTNLKSVFLCSQQAARRMIQADRGGRIIAMSSIHAVLSEPNCGHYTAAKGGIESFCRTLATELAPSRITVNYIRPGATYTELTIPMYTDSVKRSLNERIPLKEIAQASWIAAGAVYLASDDACYITGQSLTIDGGYTMDGSLPSAEYCKD